MATPPAIFDASDYTLPPFLRRVRIRGYKSIEFCDVQLHPLTILVGRNAAGKSNFLDALGFIRDAIDTNITEATQRQHRGGWKSIVSRFLPKGEMSLEIEINLSAARPETAPIVATYGFTLQEGPKDVPVITHEWFQSIREKEVRFDRRGDFSTKQQLSTQDWKFTHPEVNCAQLPVPRPDRLWLASLAHQPFMAIADRLRLIGIYNFHPNEIRELQKPNPGTMLDKEGRNIASVIERLAELDPKSLTRVSEYLSAIVPDVKSFAVAHYGEYETVRFRLQEALDAASMSDGTLRALASLMAAYQTQIPSGPSVIGIEEPETALHPAAMRALVDALDEATQRTQILLTTHSADLLSGRDINPGQVLVVRNLGGKTQITPVDPASREIIQKELYSLADLQRMDKLDLDEADLRRQAQLSQQGA